MMLHVGHSEPDPEMGCGQNVTVQKLPKIVFRLQVEGVYET